MQNPINRQTWTAITWDQVREAKLPISQKIITETCSFAINFKKLIPADNIAATIIPDKIKLLDDNPPIGVEDEYDKKITKNRVAPAPAKAKSGTDTVAAARFNNMAILAPKAAPAETPNVYGSARGLSKSP